MPRYRVGFQSARMANPFHYFKTSPEIIRLAVMMYIRFPLSLRNVEDLLHERGIDISHETVRYWWNRFGRSEEVGPDRLRSYGAAKRETWNEDRQVTSRHENNRAENCHLPFRRRERAMARFRPMRSLQKFTAAHASVHNHFNLDRAPERRPRFKDPRDEALAEWRQLLAAQADTP